MRYSTAVYASGLGPTQRRHFNVSASLKWLPYHTFNELSSYAQAQDPDTNYTRPILSSRRTLFEKRAGHQ